MLLPLLITLLQRGAALQPSRILVNSNDSFFCAKSTYPNPTPLPSNGKVLILFRGQAFRGPTEACQKHKLADQLNATSVFVTNVIEPLEARGNKVDLIVGSDPECSLMQDLLAVLGQERILTSPDTAAKHKKYYSPGQGENMAKLIAAFKSTASASDYDLLFFVRHDLLWKTPITTWDADFARLNFPSFCEEGSGPPADMDCSENCPCVTDVAQVMPGRLFDEFDDRVGEAWCFDPTFATGYCHFAFNDFHERLQKLNPPADVGVLCDYHYKGPLHVRGKSPFLEILSQE